MATSTMSMHRIYTSRLRNAASTISQQPRLPHASSKPQPTPQNRTYASTAHPPGRLTGRTCMITGGSSGIGFAIAQRYLQEGAQRVILMGRSYERLVLASGRLQQHTPTPTPTPTPTTPPTPGTLINTSDRLSLFIGDVSNATPILRELEQALHAVDILINAAGISSTNILPRTKPEEISQVLRTNLEGATLTSRAFLRAAIRSGIKNRRPTTTTTPTTTESTPLPSKCIINISSLLAWKAGTGAVPYAASKAGVLGLTRSMAVEAAASLRNVRVRSNAIVPGYIETPMIAGFSEGENARLKETIPLRRFGQPSEVADAAVFLAENEYANNCVLNLDGGLGAV